MPRDDGPTIDAARRAALLNARRLVDRAVSLYAENEFPVACFLAMTAIEECGKTILVGLPRRWIGREKVFTVQNPRAFMSAIRDHTGKCAVAAGTLFINSAADRRQGIHPRSGMFRTSGVVLLARSNNWMRVRNRCLYVDVSLSQKQLSAPSEQIGEDFPNYFIRMAYEIMAEAALDALADSVLGGHHRDAFAWEDERIDELLHFMNHHEVDVDHLWFLDDPEPLRGEAARLESAERTPRTGSASPASVRTG